MVDILPQRWADSQGSADAAIARVGRDRPLCLISRHKEEKTTNSPNCRQ